MKHGGAPNSMTTASVKVRFRVFALLQSRTSIIVTVEAVLSGYCVFCPVFTRLHLKVWKRGFFKVTARSATTCCGRSRGCVEQSRRWRWSTVWRTFPLCQVYFQPRVLRSQSQKHQTRRHRLVLRPLPTTRVAWTGNTYSSRFERQKAPTSRLSLSLRRRDAARSVTQ